MKPENLRFAVISIALFALASAAPIAAFEDEKTVRSVLEQEGYFVQKSEDMLFAVREDRIPIMIKWSVSSDGLIIGGIVPMPNDAGLDRKKSFCQMLNSRSRVQRFSVSSYGSISYSAFYPTGYPVNRAGWRVFIRAWNQDPVNLLFGSLAASRSR